MSCYRKLSYTYRISFSRGRSAKRSLEIYHSAVCLVVKVGAEDIGEHPDAFASRCFPCPLRSCSAEPGRRSRTPRMRWRHAGRVYLRRNPSRRQPPSRFRPGLLWLHPTVGRSVRAAAVNRPVRMNAHQRAFCRRRDCDGVSQVSYPLKATAVLCLGL